MQPCQAFSATATGIHSSSSAFPTNPKVVLWNNGLWILGKEYPIVEPNTCQEA